MKEDFLIVHKKILPDCYEKVLAARRMLETGAEKDVSAAVRKAGISRSTYYKYKDYVYDLGYGTAGRKAVLSVLLSHERGVLSNVLNELSNMGANVLTISQSLPICDAASVMITLDIGEMEYSVEKTLQQLILISGVENANLIAVE